MSGELSGAPRYSGPANISYTSVTEAEANQGAEGQQAPAGATAVPVHATNTVSGLMEAAGLDWSNPEHRLQFYKDNPQFINDEAMREFPELRQYADQAGGRDPDLIFPGEVLYIRGDAAVENDGTGDTTPATDTDGDSVPDSTSTSQAQTTTNGAVEDYQSAQAADEPGMDQPVDATPVFDAVQGEIEYELEQYIRENPDASPEEIEAKATEVMRNIQARHADEPALQNQVSMDYRRQEAINQVSAEQRGINLDGVASGTEIQDGPYTDTHGPFAPKSTIQDEDGRDIRIDANGYPANGTIPVTDEESGQTRYVVYEDGVATGQEWEGLPERPAAPATTPQPPEQSPVIYVVDPPATNADETDAAAQAYYEAGAATPGGASEQQQAFMAAVRAELATGATLESIKARYGNDPWLNQAIDEAAYGPR